MPGPFWRIQELTEGAVERVDGEMRRRVDRDRRPARALPARGAGKEVAERARFRRRHDRRPGGRAPTGLAGSPRRRYRRLRQSRRPSRRSPGPRRPRRGRGCGARLAVTPAAATPASTATARAALEMSVAMPKTLAALSDAWMTALPARCAATVSACFSAHWVKNFSASASIKSMVFVNAWRIVSWPVAKPVTICSIAVLNGLKKLSQALAVSSAALAASSAIFLLIAEIASADLVGDAYFLRRRQRVRSSPPHRPRPE